MKKTLNVEGMSCEHCKARVESAVSGVSGVTSAEVSLENNSVSFEYDGEEKTVAAVSQAVEEAGYDIVK